jgi:pre-mRNA processing factor 3 (PRP3)
MPGTWLSCANDDGHLHSACFVTGLSHRASPQEMRKLRKQRREEREKEKQDLIRQGLLEPPPPKVCRPPRLEAPAL